MKRGILLVVLGVSLLGCNSMSDGAKVWCKHRGEEVSQSAKSLKLGEISIDEYLDQSGPNYAKACEAAYEARS